MFLFPAAQRVSASCARAPLLSCFRYKCSVNNIEYCCATVDECSALQNTPTAKVATISDLGVLIQQVISYVLGFAGIAFFILLVAGGFKYITSGGDPKAVEGAQKTLTSAIAGLVVILVSYLILVLIKTITGVDVTTFKIAIPR